MYSGIYIIKLKKPAFDYQAGRIIYIGKGNNVEKRLRQELGQVSGAATFFRSIGVLLGKTVICGSGKNFKFLEHEEIASWLKENTESKTINCDWRLEEKKLIVKHKPPFNFIHNSPHYHQGLLELRKQAKQIGQNLG